MSRRNKISKAFVELINANLEGTTYVSNIFNSAENKLRFWDEIGQFPYLSVVSGDEFREYEPGGFKWGFLTVIIRVYTKGEDPEVDLEQFFEDIEVLLDRNNNLEYLPGQEITEITINSLTTDEGVMKPLAIGEITTTVRYPLMSDCDPYGPCPI